MAIIPVYIKGDAVLTDYEADSAFQDYINGKYPTVSVLGYNFDPARALKALDETAYHEEFLSWANDRYRYVEVPQDIWVNRDEDQDIIEYADSIY